MKKQITLLATILLGLTFGYGQKTEDLNKNRRYDEISWLITHNAFQNPEIGASDGGAGGKNQQHSINTQLNNGVRSFMIDLQYGRVSNVFKGSFLHLGHGAGGYFHWMEMCDFLEDIKRFLDRNRNEIITLHMQIDGDVTVNHINDAFNGRGNRCNSRADIDHYLYSQPQKNKRWPTLNALIQTNKRLIVLSERNFGNNAPSWLHYEFDFTRQNDFAANNVSDLLQTHRYDIAGNPGRGDNRSSLLTINNFVTDAPLGYGDGNKSADANGYRKMKNKLLGSWVSFAKRPSMAVDFYEKNNYSSRKAILEANKWNEVRGRFKYSNGADFTGYVEVNSNIESTWRINGAKVRARLHYSLPARPGESRIITFSHPDYNFSPNRIRLGRFDGANKRTYIQDITVTRKRNLEKLISSKKKELSIQKKSKNHFVIDLSEVSQKTINLNVYDMTGRLIEVINSSGNDKVNFELTQSGLYIVQGNIDGEFYSKKILN